MEEKEKKKPEINIVEEKGRRDNQEQTEDKRGREVRRDIREYTN